MTMGRKKGARQGQLFLPAHRVPKSPGHPFYKTLNRLLAEVDFDRRIEALCLPYYNDSIGRPSIAPGVYFRMLFVGYYEDIDSQRGIAWRCADSRSLGEFLGLTDTQKTPDHSSLTRIHQRLPINVYDEVFALILSVADKKGLLKCKTVALDSTMLEANAAMKSIVRRDSGQDWNEYIRTLMAAEGIDDPSDEDMRRFDNKRKGKKVSNKDWESPTDPDSRVARMKDKRTHMAYRASHTIDIDTEIIVNASVDHADMKEADSLPEQIEQADENLQRAGCDATVKEVVADKGYHKTTVVTECASRGVRTYIPEQKVRGGKRRWAGRSVEEKKAHYANRRRVQGKRGRALQKLRSERIERSFAHVCRTGGGRRAWLCGLEPNRKRYTMLAVAHNLGRIMRALFGIGKPRGLQGHADALLACILGILALIQTPPSTCGAAMEHKRTIAAKARA